MAVHVLEFSIVLQLAAVFVALRLGDVTGWRVAWILIAFGLLLMGASQATAFISFFPTFGYCCGPAFRPSS